MSSASKNILRVLAAALAFGILSPDPNVFAQATPPAGPSSVLPTGGGAALLDPSDTVILLLDHQAGLFQTVKDISVSDLRANVTDAREACDPAQDSSYHDSFRAQRTQWADHAGDSNNSHRMRSMWRVKGEVNAWDNEDFVKDSAWNGTKDADYGGCLDERLRDVPGAGCKGGGIQGLCGDRCVRRPERTGVAHDTRTFRASWRYSHVDECSSCPRFTARGIDLKRQNSQSSTPSRRRTTPP